MIVLSSSTAPSIFSTFNDNKTLPVESNPTTFTPSIADTRSSEIVPDITPYIFSF